MVTKKWKIYGIDGHRQRASFFPSNKITWDNGESYEELNADKTGTNDYSLVVITAATKERCNEILNAQLLDGAFECCRYGKIEEIDT